MMIDSELVLSAAQSTSAFGTGDNPSTNVYDTGAGSSAGANNADASLTTENPGPWLIDPSTGAGHASPRRDLQHSRRRATPCWCVRFAGTTPINCVKRARRLNTTALCTSTSCRSTKQSTKRPTKQSTTKQAT